MPRSISPVGESLVSRESPESRGGVYRSAPLILRCVVCREPVVTRCPSCGGPLCAQHGVIGDACCADCELAFAERRSLVTEITQITGGAAATLALLYGLGAGVGGGLGAWATIALVTALVPATIVVCRLLGERWVAMSRRRWLRRANRAAGHRRRRRRMRWRSRSEPMPASWEPAVGWRTSRLERPRASPARAPSRRGVGLPAVAGSTAVARRGRLAAGRGGARLGARGARAALRRRRRRRARVG